MNLLMWLVAPIIVAAPSVYQLYPNSYPPSLASKPKDSLVDSSYSYNRECTSYVAWKVFDKYHYSIKDWGDAKGWVQSAINHHIPVGLTPKVGSVGVSTVGPHGHVFYVESMYEDGLGLTSQYNLDGSGNYSVNELYAYKLFPDVHSLKYIYFN